LQAKLPKLPVPELDKTLSKYLRSVQPFLSESEYDETKKIVENFGQAVRDLAVLGNAVVCLLTLRVREESAKSCNKACSNAPKLSPSLG
jgi:hypothetical protein